MLSLRFFSTTVLLCFCAFSLFTAAGAAEKNIPQTEKPIIILVAFGTSIDEARKVFDHVLESAKKQFSGHEVIYGFTARSIVKNLREEKRDKGVLTLEEAVAYAKDKGYKEIVLQSLHVVPGQKDAEMKALKVPGAKVVTGAPLLNDPKDMEAVLSALASEVKAEVPTVFCGHGNDHHPEYNTQLVNFDKLLRKRFENAVLCTVEGKPGIAALTEEIKPQTLKNGGVVQFVPLMIVAGDHMINDVMGEEAESWKSILGAEKARISRSLGYNDAILAIFWAHLQNAIDKLAAK